MQTAILTGAFALIGVVIGGFLNAWLAARSAQRADQRATLVAARAVHTDLRMAASGMGMPADTQTIDFALTADAWREHRGQLSAVLGDDEWETLETAYAVIAVEAKVTDDPGDDPAELPAKRADAIDVAREGMAVLDPYTKSTAPK